MSKKAIILGASGLTGSLVLQELLDDNRYSEITLILRKKIPKDHPKVKQVIMDLLSLDLSDLEADELYCCIGTTRKKTPDQAEYRLIDHGIPVEAAKQAKKNGIRTMCIVSAVDANPKSKIFYNRTKGEMERDALEHGPERMFILRPSIISGSRNEKRFGERVGIAIARIFRPFMFGALAKYRATDANAIAKTMIRLANSNEKSMTLESFDIV